MPTPKIVVIGSSYSAAAVFNYLEDSLTGLREPFDLLLISDKNHYLHNDLLSQYLCDSCNLEDTCQWMRGVVFLRPGISYLEAEVLSIDFNSKIISTTKGEINYQYLALAPENDLSNKTDSFVIKNLSDALKLRTHILSNLENAVFETNPEIKNSLLTYSVLGSDKEGIQLVCSISDFANRLLKNYFPEIKKSQLKFNLIEEGESVLLNKDPFYNNRIFYNLNKKGITLRTNSPVRKIESNKIILDKGSEVILGTTILSNVNASSALIQVLFQSKALCNVDLYMKLEGFDDVFMIGELANCLDIKEGLEKTVLFYRNQAKVCAANICAKINNSSMKLLKPDLEVNFLSLGYRNSIAEFRNVHIDGIFAWIFHRLFYVFCSLSWKKKLRAFVALMCNILGLYDFEHMNIYELKSSKQLLKK